MAFYEGKKRGGNLEGRIWLLVYSDSNLRIDHLRLISHMYSLYTIRNRRRVLTRTFPHSDRSKDAVAVGQAPLL